jgi:hypothetical protein
MQLVIYGVVLLIYLRPCFFSLMDSVIVSKVLEDVSAISVKIIFGEIQMRNATVSHKCCFIGG